MKNQNLVLIGMMGSGKTTMGRALSKELNCPFVDIDEAIVAEYQQTIAALFEKGEAYFRECEQNVIQKYSQRKGIVIATGGGSILAKSNVTNLKENGICIWLNRSVPDILKDLNPIGRPLLAEGTEKFVQLYEERLPIYQQVADITFDNSGSLKDALPKLLKIGAEQKWR
ncbi:shikimate kinase [Isobaculum melis]|uniref:Shikimate kinase n=1 Tax=Isobaculum melis TaxID=142588 RepID=A0A1H9U2B7_9LACT|nr:shikimate kinase [Isobaculum melis]SES03304.1 shikimate kinase [Isobaculum melis]